MKNPITYGNMEGRYFSQAKIDNCLMPLAREVERLLPTATEYHIYYDAAEDFHHLTFKVNGRSVDVRYYKVYAAKIDGKDEWSGCPTYLMDRFVEHIAMVVMA